MSDCIVIDTACFEDADDANLVATELLLVVVVDDVFGLAVFVVIGRVDMDRLVFSCSSVPVISVVTPWVGRCSGRSMSGDRIA